MGRFVLTLLLLASTAFGADVTIKGHLIDAVCGSGLARRGRSGAAHSKTCLRSPACSDGGYGVLTEDKRFIIFDGSGNEKARKLIEETSKETDIQVTVTGAVDGNKMSVSKIELQQ